MQSPPSSAASPRTLKRTMFNGKPIFNLIIKLFAVVGLITVLGAIGMTAMRVSMMHGLRSCSQAMHLQPRCIAW